MNKITLILYNKKICRKIFRSKLNQIQPMYIVSSNFKSINPMNYIIKEHKNIKFCYELNNGQANQNIILGDLDPIPNDLDNNDNKKNNIN